MQRPVYVELADGPMSSRLLRARPGSRDPHPPPHARRTLIVVSLAAAVIGGLLTWVGLFVGVGVAAFVIGAAATIVVSCAFARPQPARRGLAFVLTYAFAFALLTWPILYFILAYARCLLTGQALGE